MDRQSVLERNGLDFHRIRSSEFLRLPPEPMKSVFEKLETLESRHWQSEKSLKKGLVRMKWLTALSAVPKNFERNWTKPSDTVPVRRRGRRPPRSDVGFARG